MNRNQKIAIGCGGAGCLGLFVVAVAAGALYYYYQRSPPTRNRNSNISINSDRVPNTNSANSTSSDSSDETPSSSMSDDDKHKLFHAAGMAGDTQLTLRVLKKIGLGSSTGSDYEEFVTEHGSWTVQNLAFINSVNTPEKARAYVDAHLDD